VKSRIFNCPRLAGNRIDRQKLGFNKQKQPNNKLKSKQQPVIVQQPVSNPVVAQQPSTFGSKLKLKTINKKRKQSQQLEQDESRHLYLQTML
jgi:hypothetical protein